MGYLDGGEMVAKVLKKRGSRRFSHSAGGTFFPCTRVAGKRVSPWSMSGMSRRRRTRPMPTRALPAGSGCAS